MSNPAYGEMMNNMMEEARFYETCVYAAAEDVYENGLPEDEACYEWGVKLSDLKRTLDKIWNGE